MYFDDIYMEDMEPATRVSEYTARIVDFCMEDPYLSKEMEDEGEKFLGPKLQAYYPTSQERESAELRFLDYFLFSYSSIHYRKTPLEVFLSKKLSDFNKKDRKIYSAFRFNIYSAFEVLKVALGSHFIARDLSSTKVYKIRENRGTYYLEEGDFIIARVLPYEKDYALAHISLLLPKNISYLAKREWKRMSEKTKEKPDPLLLERTFYQKEKTREENLEIVEKNLRRKLKKYMGKKAITIRQLKKKINKTTDPAKILKELTEKIDFPSSKEFVEFQDLFNLFWNLSSREEFGGKSPEEKIKEVMGPKEKELVKDLTSYIASKIDPDKFSSQEELERKVEEYKNKWLSEPQPELNGKTPWQVITEERKRLGSPRKGFPFKISVTPILKPEVKSKLNKITPKDTPLVEDVETFINYFERNKVKVTPKNKWIPFKHLKIIEQNFKYKDSFVFLGKEEKRGEESRKRYINFIDKLCRAKRLIRVDNKGRINVNKTRVEEFREKPYGKKLFELFCTWVEKVDWKDLQPNDFLDYYCDMYQKDFQTPLYHLDQLRVDEKITPEQMVRKLYASKIGLIESQEGLLRHLSLNLKSILLDYLKWLGVIQTEEKEIIKEMGIYTIKKFWVTATGKILIEQMILHFIQKGKIKV